MASDLFERGVAVSLLDRLTDTEPRVPVEPPSSRVQSLRQVKASLRRDLEALFNTRRTPIEPPAGARELPRSVFYYGLPDLTGLAVETAEQQERLAHLMEAAIAMFEPRLVNVTVTVLPHQGPVRVLRFRIEAALRTEPAPERVFFDTVLHLASGAYQLEGEKRAG